MTETCEQCGLQPCKCLPTDDCRKCGYRLDDEKYHVWVDGYQSTDECYEAALAIVTAQLSAERKAREAAVAAVEAMWPLVEASRRLVQSYEQDGNGVGVKACEDHLIDMVHLTPGPREHMGQHLLADLSRLRDALTEALHWAEREARNDRPGVEPDWADQARKALANKPQGGK